MTEEQRALLTRRQFQKLALAIPAPIALAVALGQQGGELLAATPTADATPTLPPTPECGDDDDLDMTLQQTEGPYFTRDSPERASLIEEGMPGTPLIIDGFVYSTDCRPVPDALLDFWQADDSGQYDNEGYRLRGHQFTDEQGYYRLETIYPGLYPGRTRHIHLKAQAPNGPILTSQIYFPDVDENERDGIFNPELLVEIPEPPGEDGVIRAHFTFVVENPG